MEKKKNNWFKGILMSVLYLTAFSISAQTLNVSGTVSDDTGAEVIGATVIVVGDPSKGTVTDIDGNYTLNNVPANASLQFSFVGMVNQVIPVNGRTTINVVLVTDTEMLDEVVVTALGISREKKTLGYSLQELKGDMLLETRENNLANALSGKVTGLQVIRSSNGPAGSSKLVLRGYSSLTGDNQPLIVVDDIPVENFTGSSNNDYWNPSTDMGNGLGDINPEDIESMSVLKGASAAALYGSRAGNGVILITTKSGTKREGLGITVSSSVGFEQILTSPEMQNTFGQGADGIFDNRSNYSWGPKITGQNVTKWDGSSSTLQAFNNVDNFFNTGVNLNNNISFQQQINNISIYTSLTRTDDKSMIPGSDLSRTNLMTRSLAKLGSSQKWTIDTKVQYIQAKANNRPLSGHNNSNSFRTMYLLPVSMDIRDFSNPLNEFGSMVWYGGGQQVNPYWSELYNLNSDSRDRFIFHGSLRYV